MRFVLILLACLLVSLPVYADFTPPATGRIAPALIQKTFRQNWGKLSACIDAARVRIPDLGGTLVVRVLVDTNGAVEAASEAQGTDLPDVEAKNCLLTVVRNMRFPEPEQGKAMFTFPLEFVSPSKAEAPAVEAAPEQEGGSPTLEAKEGGDAPAPEPVEPPKVEDAPAPEPVQPNPED